MIARKTVEKVLGEDKKPFQNRTLDHNFEVIKLVRERIPMDELPEVIIGANHDIIYICDIDLVCKYFQEADLDMLAECNTLIEEDCLSLFV